MAAAGGNAYPVTLNGTLGTDGTVIPALAAGGVADASGNAGPAAQAVGSTTTIDRVAPQVSALTATTPTRASSIAYTLTFDEPVSGLAAGDFTVGGTSSGWTVTGVSAASGTTVTVQLAKTSPADGTVVLSLGAGTVADAAGNVGPASSYTGSTVTIDRTAPTVSTFSATTPTRTSPIAYTLTFSEPVTGLGVGDFTLGGTSTGWSVTGVSGSGASYTVNVANGSPSTGTVVLTLSSGAVTDGAGNTAPAAGVAAGTVTFDAVPPTATWTPPSSPTNAAVPSFALAFDKPVTGIASSDFTNQGTATGCVFTPSASSGSSITVSVSGCSEGTVIARLGADMVTDAPGNTGPTANADSGSITIDRTPPGVAAFASTGASPTRASTATFRITFDTAVTGLSAADLTPTGTSTGWSVDSVTGSGTGPYTVALSAGSPTSGSLGLDLAPGAVTDSAGNTGPASTASAGGTITIDVTPPGAPSFTAGPTGDIAVATATFTFTGAGTGDAYQCQVDGAGAWTACASPRAFTGLSDGAHSLSVRLVDDVGNTGSPVTRSYTVDTAAPTSAASITSGPADASATSTTSATLAFTGADPGETYSCRLDGAAWAACTSPQSLSGLADGPHEFQVATTDAAGNRGPVATRTWTVDTVAPTSLPSITSAPVTPGNDDTPTFAFGGAGTGETYACAIDSGAFAACTSPLTASTLADGAHTFKVALVDAAGNRGSATTFGFTVDTVAPSSAPSITSSPSTPSGNRSSSIAFSGAQAGETYECKVDSGAWSACTSPEAIGPLADGSVTFSVRRVDAAANAGPAATATWTVDATAPAAPTLGRTPSATPTASASATVTITGAEAGGSFECSLDGAAWAACTSPRSLTSLADGSHGLRVRQIDAAGNAGAIATETWVVDTVPPSSAPSITSGPTGGVNVDTASFAFTGAGSGDTYECAPDGAGWAACTSPDALTGLADGNHTWQVRLKDAAGNAGPIASRLWTVFTSPPPAPAGSVTPASTSSSTSTFTFTGATTSTFECQLDSGAWAACTSPFTTPTLPDGTHVLEVRQVDGGGNVSAPPHLTFSWTIDSQAPASVAFGNVPASPTNATTAAPTMTISANQPGVATYSLECKVDGGAWQMPCPTTGTAPGPLTLSLSGLTEGDHEVVARQRKTLADSSSTLSVESGITWTVDTTPPAPPVIASRPTDPSNQATGTFGISAPAGTTLECKLDSGSWAACTSPANVSGLSDGSHTFSTRAVDHAGNASTVTAVAWTVDTVAPAAPTFTSTPAAGSASSSATFGFSLPAGGASAMCSLDGAAPVACSAPYTVTGLGDGSHTMEISVVDAAGNIGSGASYTWTVDTTAPAAAPGIASGPSGTVQSTSATFAFTGAGAGDGYQCNLDGGGWASCATPYSIGMLGESAHALQVRVVDAVGNTGPTATRTWTVDRTPPAGSTTITTSPDNPSPSATPTLAFTGATPPDAYACKVDGGAWAPCTSPFTPPALSDGTHSFQVALIDEAGNIGTPSTHSWVVDTTAPSSAPTILSGPSAFSNDLTPSLGFTGAGVGETYACKVDSGSYAACTSPFTAPQLASGAHTFVVAVVDAAGNRGPDATRTWVTLADPPSTIPSITSGPNGPTNDPTPTWAFIGAASDETYECSIDGDAYTACTSPFTAARLDDGAHTLDIRTVDQAGNGGTPLTRQITVDTATPGDPSLSGAPSGSTNATSVSVNLGGEPGTTFECKLDSGAWAPCPSPFTASGLADGAHTLQVRATDPAGNVRDVTTATWTVDTAAPTAPVIGNQPVSPTSQTSVSMTLSPSEPGDTFECQIDGTDWAPCTSPIALTGLDNGTHVVKVRELDAAGNASQPVTITWAVDTVAPASAPGIAGVPAAITASTSLSATLTGEPGTTFQCRVDGGGWATCTSPVTRTGLSDGTHSIEARLLDAAGNAGPVARQLWTIDTSAPADPPAIGDMPASTADSTPTFTFTGDGSTTFQCQVDGGAWTACTSPFTTDPLIDGVHTVKVRQVDAAGNLGPEATSAFTVDTNAPAEVEVSGIPASPTNQTSATMSFALEPDAVLECRIDGSGWLDPCPANPLTMSGLGQGAHELVVRQRDSATPPNYSSETAIRWMVDTTAPLAPGMSPRPADPTNNPNASIGITSEPGTTTECRLLGGAWEPCANPAAYAGLADGAYVLDIRSTDAAGNHSALSTVRWSVDTTPPTGTAVVTSGPASPTASSVATFNFTLGSDGASAQCSLDGATWTACTSPATFSGITPGTHTLRVRILDAAGNVGSNVTTSSWEMFVPPNPPAGTPGVRVNNGDQYATSRAAIADIIWTAGTRFIDLANQPDYSDAVRSPISTQVAWTLAAGAAGNRTVYYRFADSAGSVTSTGSDAIMFDPDPPVVAAIALQPESGDVVRVTPTITDPASGLRSWQATVNPASPGPVIGAATASTTVVAPGGQTVYVRGIDNAGNVSAWTSAAVPVAAPAAPAAPGTAPQATIELTGTTVRDSGDAVVGARCQSASGSCQVKMVLVVGGKPVSSTDGVVQ
ncbi:MAG: Ig-like domain-containing protein, partial [Actinomycetota bacterium]